METSELQGRLDRAGVVLERVTICVRCRKCDHTWGTTVYGDLEGLRDIPANRLRCIECFEKEPGDGLSTTN